MSNSFFERKKTIFIVLGCMFLECDEQHIANNYIKGSTSVSNTVFERRLFKGLLERKDIELYFLSAPSVGWYPKTCKKIIVDGFTSSKNFIPIKYKASYLFSSISKYKGFKKQVLNILNMHCSENTDVCILGCEMHLPYLKAIKYAKKKSKKIKSILFIPDLPEYNNRSKSLIYRILKKVNVFSLHKLAKKYIDGCVLFSKEMAHIKYLKNKKFFINEGFSPSTSYFSTPISRKKIVTYIGKLDARNGIKLISEAADILTDYSFHLYGIPASDGLPDNFTFSDRVFVHGFVSPSKINEILSESDILLSPRFSNQEYTKYSFPSKMFDYLAARKPIISFRLDCYPELLNKILLYPDSTSTESLVKAIRDARPLNKSQLDCIDKFLASHSSKNVINKLINFYQKL